MHSLLFVDDEKAILMSLKRLFFGHNLDLYFAEDGYEALQILSENKIDMIITDMRMPKMDGHKLLKEVQHLYPDTMRFILSGYTDEQRIYEAVMDASAKMYLLKPWEPKKLLEFVLQIFEFRDVLENRGVLKYINFLRRLPADKSMHNEIYRLLNGEENLAALTLAIEEDPWFSAKVLKFANASYFGSQIGSIEQAVLKLGRGVLETILLNTDTSVYIDVNADMSANYRRITKQARKTNYILKLIYENIMGDRLLDSSILAGLLHDIGLIIAEKQFTGHVFPMEKEAEFLREPLMATHAEIGGYLLRWWGIPESIVECALYHHNPLSASPMHLKLVCAVHLADFYAWQSLGEQIAILEPKAFTVIGMEQKDFEIAISPFL